MAISVVPYIVLSVVVEAPIQTVWEILQLQNHDKFHTFCKRSELVEKSGTGMDIVRWQMGEEDVIELQIEAYSALDHWLTYSVISSKRDLPYEASGSTIKCYEITDGDQKGNTFVQYTGEYASDATAKTLEGGKLKRLDHLNNLCTYFRKQKE